MNTKRKCEPCGIMEDWFLRIDNLEGITINLNADVNAINAHLADLDVLVIGNVNLSMLLINSDKDWLGYNITNVGSIEVDGAVNCNSLNTGAAQASTLSVQNLSIGEYISGNLAPLVDNSIDVGSIGLNRWFKNGYFKGNLNVNGTVDGVDISGSINQGVKTTDSPSFNQLTLASGQIRCDSGFEFKNIASTSFQPLKASSLKFSTDSGIRLDSHTNQVRIVNENGSVAKNFWIGGGAGITITHPGIISSGGLSTSGNINFSSADLNITAGGSNRRRFLWVPASEMQPSVSSGCSALVAWQVSNGNLYQTHDFDKDSTEYGKYTFMLPTDWDGGSITVYAVWTSTGTGNAFWRFSMVGIGAGDSINPGWSSSASKIDGGAANTVIISAITATLEGSAQPGDLISGQIYRLASDVGDTLNADARLIGIRINYGIGKITE